MTRGKPEPAYVRFAAKVLIDPSGCLLWTAAISTGGYGTFALTPSQKVYAHRWSYEQHVGPIPDGLQLDHLCRVRRCVNPTHLEPVTNRENALRAPHAQTAVCTNGHPRTPENTYRRRDNGGPQCRRCTSDRTSRIGRERRAPQSTDLTRACPGDPGWLAQRDARPDPLAELVGDGNQHTQ